MQKIKDQSFIKSFGNKLRETRKLKNFSQEQLAFEADIPISQVGRIERGEVNTTISTVSVLAKALKVSLKELFEF
ncbi:helix-turn-helix transcriptional regulator [Salegentibacter maritimus]|uniref:Helix-turn-helix transcriptional regulator n=1 Tax=Salegentibacter maritimus TaxID=2794347 RepID=A0ABS0TJI1_9FLAO|nr:helix-turn-helix transcriptional regulator [Salegentibacter maritimus]MBI6121178.1 helix-turn-helix transcriptional regulator [Salegentibacter maritimus]